MSEAPERIWAAFEGHPNPKDRPYVHATTMKTKGVEYIRADLYAEARSVIDKSMAELRAHSEDLETLTAECDCLYKTAQRMAELVVSAYKEGWTNGAGGMCSDAGASWDISETRAALYAEGNR